MPIERPEYSTPSNAATGLVPRNIRNGLITIAIAAVLSIILDTVLPYEEAANRGLALLLFVAILWFTEAVHITITALMVPVLGVLLFMPSADSTLPSVTIKQALTNFAHPIIFLFFGGFALATAMQVQRIDFKIARHIIKLSGSRLLYATIALCGVTAFLSMWMSNTATAAMILPLAIGLLSSVDKTDRNTRVFVLLAIAYSASIGGIGTYIGSPPNGIAAEALGIDFLGWMAYGLPVMLALLPIMFIVLLLVFRPNLNHRIALENDEHIPWTPQRIMTVVVFAATALLWILGSQLEKLGISGSDTVVAISAVIAVVALGLATWPQVVENTDWGVLLLFGGGITLSAILKESGASLVLGQQVADTFGHLHPLLIITIISAFIIFLTEFTSNTASAALLVPIFGTIGVELGMPKETLVLVIGIGASCAFMLPVATPPNAIVFGTGEIRQRDMIRGGIYLNVASIIFVALFSYYFIH